MSHLSNLMPCVIMRWPCAFLAFFILRLKLVSVKPVMRQGLSVKAIAVPFVLVLPHSHHESMPFTIVSFLSPVAT